MNRFFKTLATALVSVALAACGGGGGSSGSTPGGGGGGGGGDESPAIASMIYTLSKAAVDNTGADSSVLVVTALDADNNPVEGVPLSVSVDSGVYTPTTVETDASGQASGTITIGADRSNREITASIRLGSERATAVVQVIGSEITLTPVPATPAPGSAVRVEIRVRDANGAGVPNAQVELSGTLGLTGTVTSDATGNAVATLRSAPSRAGNYTVIAESLGIETVRTVQVVGNADNGIPNATGTISSPQLAIVPNTIAPNTTGSTTNRAVLRAKFLDAQNRAIQNVRVRFEIVPPALGAGEKISTESAIVYTDANGEATADYIAGTRSSPTDGVRIRACYGPSDASLANGACPNFEQETLTVAGQPLSITLGDNNLMQKGNSDLTYIKKFDVAVADAAGNAVADAVISASVDITRYRKGQFGNPDGDNISCPNEDTNRNGSLDAGEDTNGNGDIEPRKADIILSFLGTNKTGSNGRMTIQVEYPQNVATWLEYVVTVTTSVAGSEGSFSKRFVTNFIEGDEDNGSFLVAPYGSVPNCANPN